MYLFSEIDTSSARLSLASSLTFFFSLFSVAPNSTFSSPVSYFSLTVAQGVLRRVVMCQGKEITKQHIFLVRIGVWDVFASILSYKPTSPPPRRTCGVRVLESRLSLSPFLSSTRLYCVSLFFMGSIASSSTNPL